MDKTKLAICIEDEEYEARFVKCVMKHYKESYEIHIFSSISEILQDKKKNYQVVITGDGNELEHLAWENGVLLVLQEGVNKMEASTKENIIYTEKYQEVYKIMETVERVVSQRSIHSKRTLRSRQSQLIGVFSLTKESLQIAFSALLAEILGEQSRVLFFDIQPFSGFSTELDWDEEALGMEDLMAVATTENYTNNRLTASIGREQRWDYVYPVKNTQCLVEADGLLYEKILDILQKERNYNLVIVNFGNMFPGVIEFMDRCQQLYFLTERREERNWREENFFRELGSKEEGLLQKIFWIEIPAPMVRSGSWRQLAKSWLWNEIGDNVREINWTENENGARM